MMFTRILKFMVFSEKGLQDLKRQLFPNFNTVKYRMITGEFYRNRAVHLTLILRN